MSVILEFTLDSEDFRLGEVLSGALDGLTLELERVVPTGTMVVPFVWASGADHDAFENRVRDHPAVKELLVLDQVGDNRLYRIEWEDVPTDLIKYVAEAEAVLLEATANGRWAFRLRFPDHDKLSVFHNRIIEHSIPIHIERTYTLTEGTERGHRFGLSPEQREALVLALRRGYFETPSQVELDDLAEELGISRQAVSARIRRGNKQVLDSVLLGTGTDRD